MIPGLNPDRADIIVAGIVVFDELMNFLGANRMLVNERGIREGLIIRAMNSEGLMSEVSPPRKTGKIRSWNSPVCAR